MISTKARLKQLASERRASLRILKSMAAMIEGRLERTIHGFLSNRDVSLIKESVEEMGTCAEALCNSIGFNPEDDEEDAIRALFTSPEGEKAAREFIRLSKLVEVRVLAWDEGRHLSREQLDVLEPSPLVVRDRILAEQYSALCRHAEAHIDRVQALLAMHHLQFWLEGEKFCFNGQAQQA